MAALRWRKAATRLALSGTVLAVLLLVVDWDVLRDAAVRVGWRNWGAVLFGFVALHLLSAMKWRWFCGLAGARFSPAVAVRSYFAGLFANLCLPSLVGGDVLRAGMALRHVERKQALVLGSVLDRAGDVLALGLLVLLGAAGAPAAVRTMERADVSLVWILGGLFGAMALAGATAALVLSLRPVTRWPRRLRRHGVALVRALRTLRGHWLLALLGLLTAAALQAAYVALNVLLGGAMGLAMDVALWFLLWPLAKIAAMMPVSLGGLGVREAAFATLVVPFGIVPGLAVAESLVWQSVLIAGGGLGGLYWLATRRPGETLT